MSLATLIAVSIGGALGALTRNKTTTVLKVRFTGEFPLPTLIINITACFLAGVALYFAASINSIAYLALTMGFLGGFSTLSTMNYEAVELICAHKPKIGFGYLAVSYASTLCAAALGFCLTGFFA